ncbi:hypothetical protein [Mycoplasma suis]|uniref:Uncharacterized protein n=1 Tax=Mycoplasma suis (strain Illinois) TaxID=768700 RepID=F0QS56_MYCSL|nr:hypothetical protein [Mycoplasma suis]ADX98326.1 hypothetical protein MSU_0805 [Mycoplasma suis str. Illinois]
MSDWTSFFRWPQLTEGTIITLYACSAFFLLWFLFEWWRYSRRMTYRDSLEHIFEIPKNLISKLKDIRGGQ